MCVYTHMQVIRQLACTYNAKKSKRLRKMPTTLRLSTEEQEQLRKKCIEINKLLIKMGREPVKDSELAHIILAKSMSYIEVGQSGEINIVGK